MSTLIKAKINRDKINSKLLFKGEKGTYLNIDIWINDKPDKYGNNVSIEQQVGQGEDRIYIGEGKIKWMSDQTVKQEEKPEEAEVNDNPDDLPF